ncbi:MAG: NAD(P)-dependent glycerol-3-phosphate dehydrogenase [Solobacterium sp.]|nr:NAD(P)-dependent glycerol-3-phosphate dehydrogenase [Solobacterium sp.]MBQ6357005.1 NAD(P)-dependent glycerol-3-phosphate dehydrogenase [Solobacterium sp.]MBQ6532845.1 NAD(P)-dependent glycerol-3-phosphate dehydrogenase [Solobacterium sp.]MBR0213437.1 NAD(P)-dependent glycerol-3-phosphate dehydrogenase [Solobacterium sp.]
MKTAVLGTGSWGTALAQVLADNGNDVVLWGIDASQVNDINENHRNSLFYETELNPALHADMDIACLRDADLLLFAVPSIALEETLKKAAAVLDKPVIVINVAKGFHPVTHERLSVVIRRFMPAEKLKAVVSLIGPSHAEEVIERKLTVINAVSADQEAAETVQKLFSNRYFRVYTNTDETGAEIGVAVKNIMALASGILTGIGQGDNARAALITRGLAEMTRYGVAMGGRVDTYLGLDGVGDLIVTCTSRHSRNFMAGFQIGQEGGAEHFMKVNKKTVEGIFACRIVYEEARKHGISMPITEQVYQVLYEGKDPETALNELMMRELKPEDH